MIEPRPVHTVVVPRSGEVCPECGSKMRSEPRRFTSDLETGCGKCGLIKKAEQTLAQLGGSEYDGRGPDVAVVMDNNVGCSPGPQRTGQVMSALNQDKTTPLTGLDFHLAKLDLLTLWAMSSNPTDRTVSQILKTTVQAVERKRGVKLYPARVDALARICKAGIKKAELVKRLSRKELQGSIHGIFQKEGLWPP